MKKKLTTTDSKIKKLTATIAAMATKMTNNENLDPKSGASAGGSSNCVSRQPQMKKIRNMGAYCSSHGFHPVGTNHDSVTCRNEWRKPKHNIVATWTNCLGGNTYWPSAKQVAIEQQDHPIWKGKSAPTNQQGPGNALSEKKDSSNAAFFYNKAKFIIQFLLLSIPSAMPGQRAQTQQPTSGPQQQQATGHLQ